MVRVFRGVFCCVRVSDTVSFGFARPAKRKGKAV